jgi:Protein of unknown function (DUF3089)
MLTRLFAVVVLLGVAAAASVASVPAAADVETYANPDVWLCRPGRQDACTVDQDATVIAVDGTLSHEAYQPAKTAPIDCFYVYPTVSRQRSSNSQLTITAEENNVVKVQFARFGARCRQFAPMYRQVTLTALLASAVGMPVSDADRTLAYEDVAAAWHYYVQHDNHGRGFVLIGHSQGSRVLTELIKNEIDGKPLQHQLISAILAGTSLPVPKGQDLGGAFNKIPVCRSNKQIGCVIAFASFRADVPPPDDSRFGRAEQGMQAVCANPAALGGGSGGLDAYLPAAHVSRGDDRALSAYEWTTPPKPIDTFFVKLPGLLSATCVLDEHGSYLAITLHPTPAAARTNDIPGDVIVRGRVMKDWGLHLIDVSLTLGNLLAVVGDETKAYLARSN